MKKKSKFKQLEMFTEYKVIIQYKDCMGQVWQDEFKSLEQGVKEYHRLISKEGKTLGIKNVKIAII